MLWRNQKVSDSGWDWDGHELKGRCMNAFNMMGSPAREAPTSQGNAWTITSKAITDASVLIESLEWI